MVQVIDRLVTLRVSDVMAKDILTVGKNQTMTEVAGKFVEQGLSSAPVVDELGHCVGVITASDFVNRETRLMQKESDPLGEGGKLLEGQEEQPLRCVPVGDDYVSYHMSQGVQSIEPGASLLRAARVMCDEHIHRLLVIDEQNHPIGVISTMDIIAAMVNVVDEMQSDIQRGS